MNDAEARRHPPLSAPQIEEAALQDQLAAAYRRSPYNVGAKQADYLGTPSPSEADPDVVLLEAQIKAHRLRHPGAFSPPPSTPVAVFNLLTVVGFFACLVFVIATLMMGS